MNSNRLFNYFTARDRDMAAVRSVKNDASERFKSTEFYMEGTQ